MKIVWLLDAGHGGIVKGKYSTSPNWIKNNVDTYRKMYYHNDKVTVFEGVVNRKIIAYIKSYMDQHNMKYVDVVNSDEDVSLKNRVRKANVVYEEQKDIGNKCVYYSQHSNAAGALNVASGIEIFTSPGKTQSDKIAEVIMRNVMQEFPECRARVDRLDGDLDKEARFYVLTKTKMPAVLFEFLFMDNFEDAKMLLDEQVQKRFAKVVVEAFIEIEKTIYNGQ